MSKMKFMNSIRWASALVLAATALAGCAGTGQMTPQQREGVEMRRFCEQNPQEVEKCLGFLGWL